MAVGVPEDGPFDVAGLIGDGTAITFDNADVRVVLMVGQPLGVDQDFRMDIFCHMQAP